MEPPVRLLGPDVAASAPLDLPVSAVSEIGALAVRVPVVPPGTLLPAVEELFRADDRLRGIVTWDSSGWQLISRTWLDNLLAGRYGFGRALHARRDLASLLPVETVVLPPRSGLTDAARAVLERGSAALPEMVVLAAGGSTPAAEVAVVPVTSIFAGLAAVYQRAAYTDALTGLPNRLAVHAFLAEPQPSSGAAAVLYIDLDDFKQVNDVYGHRAGDTVLLEFSARLRSCVRDSDLVARLGGDEYVALLREVDETHAAHIAERIVLAASAPFLIDGHVITIGASVGVALTDGSTERRLTSAEVLLRHADAAMYRAKSAGRGRWSAVDAQGVEAANPLSRRLRLALETGGLRVVYQAKVALAAHRVVEFEALCRWTDEDLGPVSPAEFIPLAERTGLIVALGRWVLVEACRQGRRWMDDGRDVRVAVNLSPLQLLRAEFVDEVVATLHETGLPADRLRLEITETAAVKDAATTAQRLRAIGALGVRISLDDFGTGQSSLSLLRSLPVHGVKIDKSFVDHVDTDGADAALVAAIVVLARQLGLTSIAEGVERPEQLVRLRQLGCDAAQGYLLGRPLPADEVSFTPLGVDPAAPR